MTNEMSYDSYIEGPRWEDLAGFVMKMGMVCNVRVVLKNETKSWLRKTTFYTVSGTRDQVLNFLRKVRDVIEEHNQDTNERVM